MTYPLLWYCIYRFQLRLGLTQGVLAANRNLLTIELKSACRYSKADAGSGAHVHLSIWQGNRNVFMGSGPGSKHGMSKAGQEFMAGVLLHLPSILAFTAPNPNRFVSLGGQFWAVFLFLVSLKFFVARMVFNWIGCAVMLASYQIRGVVLINAGVGIIEKRPFALLVLQGWMQTWSAILRSKLSMDVLTHTWAWLQLLHLA